MKKYSEIKPVVQNQIEAVHRLNKLVNDFLLMSQLKSGTLILQKENINIVELITGCSQRLMDKMQPRNLSLKINLLPVVGNFDVWADAALLNVIIFNLMENAVKYAKEQTQIEIIAEQKEENILFNISNVTDKFQREDNYKDGFGLGLWIVDQLVKNKNGNLLLSYQHPLFIEKNR